LTEAAARADPTDIPAAADHVQTLTAALDEGYVSRRHGWPA